MPEVTSRELGALAATKPLALTMGDPAGIGPDITLEAWKNRQVRALPPFVMFACPDLMADRAVALGVEAPVVAVESVEEACARFSDALPVIPVELDVPATPGLPDPANGGAVITSIEKAVVAVDEDRAAAVVTNPIAKSVLYAAGFKHPGHTEYLAALAEQRHPERKYTPVMLLASEEIRVVPLTIHIPLAQVPAAITGSLIESTVRIVDEGLRGSFGIDRPRIAVAGLNPHAGEEGSIGREEVDIIAPALARLRSKGFDVTGPHPADTMFHEEARKRYDAAIAMYHDQALIPIKTLNFDSGVNVTLGLPFVRTSPDHGTAFEIAGKGLASAESLIQSLRLAAAMASRRSSDQSA